jgi:inhibitor of cysteine peptidase
MDMKYVFAISAVAALAVLGGAIVLFGDSEAQGDNMEATFIEESGTMKAKVGEDVTIALEGNRTTGFDWKVVSTDGLELKSDEYTVKPHEPGLCGVGGTHYFTFHCEKAGTYNVVLDYLRDWEGSQGNTRTVQIVVE